MTKWDGQAPRAINQPEPGYFLMRLIKGGPHVPAQICRNDSGVWWAVVNGQGHAAHTDPALAPLVFTIWHSGQEIDRATYEHRLKLKEWAEKHHPDHPAAKPREKIDRLKTPIIL